MSRLFGPEELIKIEPSFQYFEEQPFFSKTGAELGWHSTALGYQKRPLGSGFGFDRHSARRIALSETIERAFVRNCKEGRRDGTAFFIDRFPTTCGFAVGFQSDFARDFSIFEALERWVRAQWIDRKMEIPEVRLSDFSQSALFRELISVFEETRCFRLELEFLDPLMNKVRCVQAVFILGFLGGGVFSGSRVGPLDLSPWEHAAMESWRHFQIYKNQNPSTFPADSYIQRLWFFGNNAQIALQKIDEANCKKWTRPNFLLHHSEGLLEVGVTVWRTLCDNYSSFHEGPIERFIY